MWVCKRRWGERGRTRGERNGIEERKEEKRTREKELTFVPGALTARGLKLPAITTMPSGYLRGLKVLGAFSYLRGLKILGALSYLRGLKVLWPSATCCYNNAL